MSQVAQNTRIIDRLVEAYNARDARAFAAFFAPDALHGNLNATDPLRGREAICARYTDVFNAYPENHSDVVHRIAYGEFVIDHERVRRSKASEPFDVVAIYTMRDGLVARIDFVRT
jgi:uncharacterized protein (TIGR02246 family)